MTLRRATTAAAAAIVAALVLSPTAHALDPLPEGTVTEDNPLGVPEPDDLEGWNSFSRTGYAEAMGIWWSMQDHMKPNCKRHVNYYDAYIWYVDPDNVEVTSDGGHYPVYTGTVLHHYPAKTEAQCAKENGTPATPTPTGSLSGSLANIGL